MSSDCKHSCPGRLCMQCANATYEHPNCFWGCAGFQKQKEKEPGFQSPAFSGKHSIRILLSLGETLWEIRCPQNKSEYPVSFSMIAKGDRRIVETRLRKHWLPLQGGVAMKDLFQEDVDGDFQICSNVRLKSQRHPKRIHQIVDTRILSRMQAH